MVQFLDYEGLKTLAKTIDSKFVRKDGIDTTFAEVVTSLPTDVTKIKKHLYLVKNASSTESQNVYSEYIYIGEIGTGKTYDASKWEKLGEFKASIDLSGYATKAQAVGTINKSVGNTYVQLTSSHVDKSSGTSVMIEAASANHAGVMTVDNFNKLQGIAAGANKTIVDSELSTSSTNPVQNKVIKAALNGKADNDIGIFTTGVATPELHVNSNNADEKSANQILATGVDGTADILILHNNSNGAALDLVRANVNGITVNSYAASSSLPGENINAKDWTLTGRKTDITGDSITSPKIVKAGGTSQQALMADGSVKDINGIVKYGTTAGTACQGNDVRLNTGANVRVNGIALGNASKNINTNGFYVIEKIFASRPTTVSTPSNVNKVAYYNGYLYGITDEGNICNNYGNKEQFGVVETTANNDILPKAPTNATYYNKENGLLYYNTGTTLEQVWDDLSSLTNYAESGDAVGLLNVGDYDAIMEKVNESPIQAITSEQINSLFT